MAKWIKKRARGCLLGQLSGDALGSLVEFESPERIRSRYPDGVREMREGGQWNTLAGQPTDDSEMALALARDLAERGTYDAETVRRAYQRWLASEPFDCGNTVAMGLRGFPNTGSQANGALMRISPLGIFGALRSPDQVAEWARMDAALTHPNPICLQANAVFAVGLARAVKTGENPEKLFNFMLELAREWEADPALVQAMTRAADAPPAEYLEQQGWVLIALGNALWQLLHAPDAETGVVDTIMRGGDTDTNAAICGALLGAVYGEDSLPRSWRSTLKHCRPARGHRGVYRPRPREYWPVDAAQLAVKLLRADPGKR